MASQKFLVTRLPDTDYNAYLCGKLQEIGNEAIASRGVFLLGVSGGSIISFLADGLPKIQTDFSTWKIFLCDERLVPEDDAENTFGEYRRKLFPQIPAFPPGNFLQAKVSLPLMEAEKDYENRIKEWTGPEGVVDCLLLGVGPDGHTCSLFPNHKVLDASESWVTSIADSPKPPPERITLTYPFINKARNILIAGKGKEKWNILEKVQNGEDFPIGRVNNEGGRLEWVLNDC